jgi:diacylglycerol kinase (ATP)
MNILSILATLVLLVFGYFYFFKLKHGFKVKKRQFDMSGKTHKFVDIGEQCIDHCAICEKLIVYGNIFGSKAKKCLICGVICHKICLKVKGLTQPCKQLMLPSEDKIKKHQWAHRKLEDEERCSVCTQYCNNIAHYHNFTCLWCNKVRHNYCKDDSDCTFGRFEALSILPHEIVKLTTNPETNKTSIEFKFTKHKSIPLFIANKLSGPQFGESTMEFLYQHLNPIQVFDLLDEGIGRLEIFKGIPDLKVIVAGGDGTMGGLVDAIYSILGRNISLIPMPLGTGNDLSRALGWGEGISTKRDVKYFLKYLETKPLPTLFDRWHIKITSKKNPENVLLDLKMLLYFGIGLDAKFSYQFNAIRKKAPFFFKSRVRSYYLTLDWQQVLLQPSWNVQSSG